MHKILLQIITPFLVTLSLCAKKQPNIIVIFADDLGYGDVSCYGSKSVKTPAIDALAAEGFRSTDFLVGSSVCGPSRAALMTGRYPMRCGSPISRHYNEKHKDYGLAAAEVTIAEQLKKAGYYNKMIGKWHLGMEVKGSHPLDAGFDSYYGLKGNYFKGCSLWRDRKKHTEAPKFNKITKLYTKDAVAFIQQKHEQPFFLYFAHHIAHTPIDPNSEFRGSTKLGKYADFVYELDDSVRQVREAVEQAGISENTLIVFLSDNGPTWAGSADPLRGGKYVTMEGSMRVPGIFHWPETIPSGQVSDAMVSSMDLLPIFSHLAGVDLPTETTLDGKNTWPVILGEIDKSPHKYFHYYNGLSLQAVRTEDWKIHLPRTSAEQPYWAKTGEGKIKVYTTLDEPILYNLKTDVSENVNLITKHPEIVKELKIEAKRIIQEIGDNHTLGSDQRPHGLVNPNEKN